MQLQLETYKNQIDKIEGILYNVMVCNNNKPKNLNYDINIIKHPTVASIAVKSNYAFVFTLSANDDPMLNNILIIELHYENNVIDKLAVNQKAQVIGIDKYDVTSIDVFFSSNLLAPKSKRVVYNENEWSAIRFNEVRAYDGGPLPTFIRKVNSKNVIGKRIIVEDEIMNKENIIPVTKRNIILFYLYT